MRHDDPTHAASVEPGSHAHAPEERRPESPPTADEPRRLGRYVVIERLGAGGMGVVYSAYDPKLDRKVAVKLLLPWRGDDAARARLTREAQAMAQLRHPNVVAVHDVGEHDKRVYIAMEFVRGGTLRAWLEREQRSWKDVLVMFVQAGWGLAAAHEAGIVHRDFKPDNVLVDDKGRAMVTDFGLAQATALATEEGASAATDTRGATRTATTRPGALVGTPAYMAPEQFWGEPVDPRTDQFALCVSLWEGLFGERPFAGDSALEIAIAIRKGDVREPSRVASVPRWLRRAVQRGLAIDPALRWPAMEPFLAELGRGHVRARRRIAVATVGFLALAGLAAETWRRADHAREVGACEEAGAAIASVWPGDDERARAAVHAGLLATGKGYAGITALRTQPWLDDYARDWQTARTQTCLSSEVERTWDAALGVRATECLDDRRSVLQALVEELSHPDATTLQKAVGAAAGLPQIAACTDPLRLAHQPTRPVESVAGVHAVRESLARARALRLAGKFDEAVSIADEAVRSATEIGWPPLVAEARATLGTALESSGDYERAESELVEAYVEAAKSGAPELAEHAASQLLYLVGYRRANPTEGLLWGRLVEVELARLDPAGDGLGTAVWLNAIAVVESRAGKHDDARAKLEHAISIRERQQGPNHPDLAQVLNNLASLRYDVGDYAAAQAVQERVLEIREHALGPDHPHVATTLSNLANVFNATGDHARATVLYTRALAIKEAALGADHIDLVPTLNNLAAVHLARERYAEAKSLFERALQVGEPATGPDHPNAAIALANLANVHVATGELAMAKALHERALDIRERQLGADHLDLAGSLLNLGNIHAMLGDAASAGPMLERALAIRERALGPRHRDVATSLAGLASVRFTMGEHTEARELYERALAIGEETLGPQHVDLAYSLVGLGDVALAQRRPLDALPTFERALALREKSGAPAEEVAEARFGVAKALWDARRERAGALALARTVEAELRAAGPRAEEALAAVRAWLRKRRAG